MQKTRRLRRNRSTSKQLGRKAMRITRENQRLNTAFLAFGTIEQVTIKPSTYRVGADRLGDSCKQLCSEAEGLVDNYVDNVLWLYITKKNCTGNMSDAPDSDGRDIDSIDNTKVWTAILMDIIRSGEYNFSDRSLEYMEQLISHNLSEVLERCNVFLRESQRDVLFASDIITALQIIDSLPNDENLPSTSYDFPNSRRVIGGSNFADLLLAVEADEHSGCTDFADMVKMDAEGGRASENKIMDNEEGKTSEASKFCDSSDDDLDAMPNDE
ncbi:unnamed protein product [Soboliphyme baturini]|uniref:CBFD_NFYB_HMF domain-containing protein n=1 Tax=Soboliphyme baturini TaxID=241478 RepID=A0A183ICB1_9BILA|nr:unnamed protein product [Soboliphyme baturini]